jgi:predicted nucleic acid-binding protein
VVFVDTGAWFAAFVPNDPDHAAADAWLAQNRELLVTTDYVLDELLTLLKVRGEFQRALFLGEELLNGTIANLEWVSPTDVRSAWEVFRNFQDKDWSFTDCVSRIIIERLGVRTAFAFDEHFRQFGSVVVVPTAGAT